LQVIKYLTHQKTDQHKLNIRILNRNSIDLNRWNECILKSHNSLHYAMAWYLDIVSPGWEGAILGNYEYIMPIPKKYRFGIHYIIQPFLTQQLGIFSEKKINKQIANKFYFLLKKKHTVLYNLNYSNTSVLPQNPKHKLLLNLELNLNKEYDELKQNFSKNTKRNIKKAKKLNLNIKDTVKNIPYEFYFHNLRFPFSPKEEKLFKSVIKESVNRSEGIIKVCTDISGQLLSVAFFINHKNRITFLGSSSSKEGYDKYAAFYIFDHMIEKYSGNDLSLDFEGSQTKGVARFYSGFGSVPTFYPQVSNKPFKTLLSIKKMILKTIKTNNVCL